MINTKLNSYERKSDGMIVAINSGIPILRQRRDKRLKGKKPLAATEFGDEAYFVEPKFTGGGGRGMEDDSDDDDDDEMFDEETGLFSPPVKSLSGEPWKPRFDDRMTVFIGGVPGAGKSFLAKELIKTKDSKIPILLFTALTESDGNFDELGKDRLFKIRMEGKVFDDMTLDKIRDKVKEASKQTECILLFDDVDKIREKKIQDGVFRVMNDALANGRGHKKHDGSEDIHVICTTHSINDYLKTKYTFENSNYVALFPTSTTAMAMYRMFEKLGLSKSLCQKVIKQARRKRIRSIIIHKTAPMYMIMGNEIMLL